MVIYAKHQLKLYFNFYNHKWPHSSLDTFTPNEFYYDQLLKKTGGLNRVEYHL